MVKPTKVTNSIRALRFANGEMTQAELADRIGVTRQTIIAIEQGHVGMWVAFRPDDRGRFKISVIMRSPSPNRADHDPQIMIGAKGASRPGSAGGRGGVTEKAAVQEMWQAFRGATGTEAEMAGAFAFGDSPAMADELSGLVLHGPKRATAGLLLEYEREGEPVPRLGDHSVVLDGRGLPVCVIKTTEAQIKPLNQADAAFAWDEGEGDRTLTWWLQAHTRFFHRQCRQLGVPFSDDLLVVFERFELVWPVPSTPT